MSRHTNHCTSYHVERHARDLSLASCSVFMRSVVSSPYYHRRARGTVQLTFFYTFLREKWSTYLTFIGHDLPTSSPPETTYQAPPLASHIASQTQPHASFSTMVISLFITLTLVVSVQAFTSPNHQLVSPPRLTTTSSSVRAAPNNDLFQSPGWESIRKELDQVPVFACANAEGQPLKYRVDMKSKNDDASGETSFEVPLFYTHVEDALKELEEAKKNTPMTGMDINPYPLGGIFELWATDRAVIVPNKQAIMQAGAPPNANPMGQNVPLFACMEIAQEAENGKPVLPLFLELEDANEAVSQAVKMDGGKAEDFEVVGLSLPEAVNLLTNSEETAFHFVPPSSSLKHIRDYLSG